MARIIWAFIAFNAYTLFLVDAFQRNTAYIFDAEAVAEMAFYQLDFSYADWAWGDHYVWRLVVAVVATCFVAFLTGAIAQKNGNKVALVANIPSVVGWLVIIYLFGFADFEVSGKTGFLVVSFLAIPATLFLSYMFGGIGEATQAEEFDENTILGIRPVHWIWGIIPLSVYSAGVIFVVAYYVRLQFYTFSDYSFIGAAISLISLLPVFVWIAPLHMSHQILAGKTMPGSHPATHGITVLAILVGGVLVALLAQFICFWAVGNLVGWWYN